MTSKRLPADRQLALQVRQRRQRGFTLIELIIFIVVVAAGLAGILSVMNTVVKSSADPMIRKQTVAIAESLLEEILLKNYCDPDPAGAPAPTCGTHVVKAGTCPRALFDNVDDYAGYTTASGIVDMTCAASGLANYNITSVTVANAIAADNAALAALVPPAKKVTVTVTGPQGPITLVGYRSNY
jgi:MSHA pilin protein MshD